VVLFCVGFGDAFEVTLFVRWREEKVDLYSVEEGFDGVTDPGPDTDRAEDTRDDVESRLADRS
jgi:hypothetical protein